MALPRLFCLQGSTTSLVKNSKIMRVPLKASCYRLWFINYLVLEIISTYAQTNQYIDDDKVGEGGEVDVSCRHVWDAL